MLYIFIAILTLIYPFSKTNSKYIINLLLIRPFITYFTNIAFVQDGRFKVSPGSIWAIFFIAACVFYLLGNIKKINISNRIQKISFVLIFTFIPSVLLSEYDNVLYVVSNYFKYLSWLLGVIVLFRILSIREYMEYFLVKMNYILYINISLFILSIVLTKLGVISYEDVSAYTYKSQDSSFGYTGFFGGTHAAGLIIFLNYIFYKLKIYVVDKEININKTRTIDLLVYIILFLTFSRTIWVVLICYLIYTNSGNKKNFIRLTILIPGVFALLMLFNPSIYEDFLYRSLGAGDRGNQVILDRDFKNIDRVGSGRFGMWRGVFLAIDDFGFKEYMFGAGFGYDFIATGDYTSSKKAHNDFLTLLLENGLINLFLFLGLLFYLYRPRAPYKEIRINYRGFYWGIIIYILFQGLIGLPDFLYFIIYYIILNIQFQKECFENANAQI